ncbi:polyadenylate-binding protein-interacting protein 8-like [Setaria italica]|uniref:polyadenylate-binding protein-interacting protein 8-like n=1 Tax=Setaria italica TaxID=4555 RepID=UPI0003512A26|nr:polyadenylate-binding protein-interacting protein 8-like [Setaria italica]
MAEGAAAVGVLNPGAREFLPWWRLDSPVRKALSVDAPEFPAKKALSVDAPEFLASPVRKALSVDAPEFEMTADIGPATAAGGGSNATPPPTSVVRTGRRAAHRPRRFLSRWQEAVKRTIFVKYIDHTVTEQILAELFQSCGNVVDCRICGDPSNGLRYGFVEFQHEEEAYAALFLDGIIIGISPLRVLPSRTAICPVNPRFLPQSEDEWEICSRTIYCTNISKTVQSSNLKAYCEAYFGKVCRLKLLDNGKRSTNLAFIEFAEDVPIQDPDKGLLWELACAGSRVVGGD